MRTNSNLFLRLPFLGACILALGLVTAGCDSSDGDDDDDPDIVDVAIAAPEFSSLVSALQAANLVGTLEGAGPFTVFAPTNSAFADVDPDVLDSLLNNDAYNDVLAELLTGHVVAGSFTAADLTDGQELVTVSGDALTYDADGFIGGVEIGQTDIVASNGVIHAIEGVLLNGLNAVERARITPDVSTLVDLVVEADLATTLSDGGPFTIFAPVNSAFADLGEETLGELRSDTDELARVLTYHVAPGTFRSSDLRGSGAVTTVQGGDVSYTSSEGGVTLNGNQISVVAADIEVENGVIHLIDGVLTPPLGTAGDAALTQ